MSSSRVLVTGAAGFVGSHLCDALLAGGAQVPGVDNLSTRSLKNLDHLRRDVRFSIEEFEIINVYDPGPVDYVFNFASPARPGDYTRLGIKTLLAGSSGTLNSLEIAKRYNAGYLHASEGDCYSDMLAHSSAESYSGCGSSIHPRAVYNEAKRYSETLVNAYHRYHRIDTHMVRIFDVYGSRLRPNDERPLPHLLMSALRGESLTVRGHGTQTMSSCYVSDVVNGILRLAFSSEHAPVNIGNPEVWTILHCVWEIQAIVGSDCKVVYLPAAHGEPRYVRPDVTRARRRLAWQPKIELRQGLKLSLGYFAASASQQRPLNLPRFSAYNVPYSYN